MLPHIHLFGMHIPMYSVMLALGISLFLLLYFLSFRAEFHNDRVTFNRLTFCVLFSIAALGVFAFLFDSLFHSIEEGKLTAGGITWLGGVVGAFPTVLILTHRMVPKKRGYELEVLDSLIPGLAVAHALGRVGCFLGGCCFGKVTDSPLGISFPAGSTAAKLYPAGEGQGSLPVLPTQLFEAVFELIVFAALVIISRKTKKYNTAIWSVSYSVFRFTLEFFRGDDRGSTAFSVSPAQLLSVLLFVFGVLLILLRSGVALRSLAERLDEMKAASDALPIVPYSSVLGKESNAEKLRELHSLMEEGLITEEEYERKKAEILERM